MNKKRIAALLIICAISPANAATAFLKGEKTSGFNKICIYDHMGSDVAITIKSTDLCPLSINV
jgi:hypothetical protein